MNKLLSYEMLEICPEFNCDVDQIIYRLIRSPSFSTTFLIFFTAAARAGIVSSDLLLDDDRFCLRGHLLWILLLRRWSIGSLETHSC